MMLTPKMGEHAGRIQHKAHDAVIARNVAFHCVLAHVKTNSRNVREYFSSLNAIHVP